MIARSVSVGRLGALIGAIVVLAGAGLTVSRSLATDASYDPDSAVARSFEDRTGVRLVRVALTAGGGVIDIRYLVLDSTKAVETFENLGHPAVVDEDTGTQLSTPWMVHAIHPKLNDAVTYAALLVNADGAVTSGGDVTVVMGDARLAHVPVS